jgi:hypothetical protein
MKNAYKSFFFVFFVVFVGYYSHKETLNQKLWAKKIPAFAGTEFYLR